MTGRWAAALLVSVCAAVALASGQARTPESFGGKFETLHPEQQRLVAGWVAEYNRITGKSLAAAEAYDSLAPSTRTTFEAVTHALLTTKLTAENGNPLGTGVDLVQMVEAVHGEIQDARGDHQFRIYVLLKPDALDRLYRSREFKRTRDNTVFHIGYPINFRQQGGAPSMQVSVTKTGRRADIDVDYRSSGGPVALFNGHLTSANSDVRAGNNFDRHVNRWSGLRNWWAGLLGLFTAQTAATVDETVDLAVGINVPVKSRVSADRPLSEAVVDFYKTWFVDATPEQALAYMSVRSYACLAEFRTGETLDSGLAALRILQHMRQGQAAYGKVTDLSEVIQAIALYPAGARPVVHDNGNLFSLQHLTDTAARAMDCRERQRVKLAEELSYGGDQFGEYYATATRLLKERGAETVLTQLWTKEEGSWKIVSWHLENPFVGAETPVGALTDVDKTAPEAPGLPSHTAVIKAATQFLTTWLVERRYADAEVYFAPRSAFCADVKNAGSARAFLASIGDALPKGQGLGDLITSVPFGHSHLEKVAHDQSSAFLLTLVSTDLAPTLECTAGTPGRNSTMGAPKFDGKTYRTDFGVKSAVGQAGEVSLLWRLERNNWRIVAAEIVAH
jgi:hypothetical protein